MVEPAALAGYLLSSKAGSEQAAPTHASRHSILEPDFDITAGSIMQLLSSRNIDWRESTDLYFQTIHPWLSIVHQERFASAVDGLGRNEIPQKRELALLVLCMQLVTQYSEPVSSTTTPSTSMLTLPAYLAAKRVLGVLRGTREPCLELIQCGILLSLFEFGHGEMRRAYMTVGDAAICAELMGLRPGKNGDMERDQSVLAEQEERRATYWGLLIVDRYVLVNDQPRRPSLRFHRLLHVECKLMWLPFRVKSPSEDDLLPTINVIWDKQTQTRNTTIQRHTANVPPSIPLGIFQRLSQCAILLTRAIELDKSVPTGHAAELFSELDVATRALIEAMVCQASRWGEYHECFSTCTWYVHPSRHIEVTLTPFAACFY